MPTMFAAFLLIAFFQGSSTQEITEKTVVEGLSVNVDILCNIDRQLHPLYWKIQGKIYDLDSIPEFFDVHGHEALNLQNVDRRLNGWSFQCFTIDTSTSEGVYSGLITRLTVDYGEQRT